MSQEVRKYYVKGSWIFNLESMQDKLWCVIYDVEDGQLQLPITIAGTVCNEIEDIMELKDECFKLEWAAKGRRVTGKEYGRIKQLVEWRVYQRYATCMASGMSDYEAGACFEDI